MTPNWFVNGMVYDWVYTSIQKPTMTGVTINIPQIGAYMGPISLTTGDGSKPYPPVVHIKIAGIYGCEYPPKNGMYRY